MALNNLLFHAITATGVISFVALFPTPERLFDAFSEDTPVVVFSEDSDTVIVDTPVVDEATISIHAPFPLECATANEPNKRTLNRCALQLVSYLDDQSTTAALLGVMHSALDPEVEQARVALTEICRLRWSMNNPPPDPEIQRACGGL